MKRLIVAAVIAVIAVALVTTPVFTVVAPFISVWELDNNKIAHIAGSDSVVIDTKLVVQATSTFDAAYIILVDPDSLVMSKKYIDDGAGGGSLWDTIGTGDTVVYVGIGTDTIIEFADTGLFTSLRTVNASGFMFLDDITLNSNDILGADSVDITKYTDGSIGRADLSSVSSAVSGEILSIDVTLAMDWQTPAALGLLTGNETITLSGDATGSGATAITVVVVDDLHAHVITNIDAFTSAQLATQITNETGSGLAVFATTPTFTTNLTSPLVIGGTGTTSDLNLKTTTGVGATGADMHFLVGNDGATEAMTILNNGLVGIGTNAPEGRLHILQDDRAIAPSAQGDDIVIEGEGARGISIFSGLSSAGNIFFGSTTAAAGRIIYDNSDNSLRFWTNGGEKVIISNTGAITLTTDLAVTEGGTGASNLNAFVLVDGSNALTATWAAGNEAITGLQSVQMDSLIGGANDTVHMGQDVLKIRDFALNVDGTIYQYDSSDVPADGDVLTLNTATSVIDWQPDAGAAAGDDARADTSGGDVMVDLGSPFFLEETATINLDAGNDTLYFRVKINSIDTNHFATTNLAVDEDIMTFETGNTIEYHTPTELGLMLSANFADSADNHLDSAEVMTIVDDSSAVWRDKNTVDSVALVATDTFIVISRNTTTNATLLRPTGTDSLNAELDKITIDGDVISDFTGFALSVSSGIINVNAATDVTIGVANFPTANFLVTGNAISIKSGGVDSDEILNQTIVNDDIDTTAENFVFDGAYHVTSAFADSQFMSKKYIDDQAGGTGLWAQDGNETGTDSSFLADADDNDTIIIITDDDAGAVTWSIGADQTSLTLGVSGGTTTIANELALGDNDITDVESIDVDTVKSGAATTPIIIGVTDTLRPDVTNEISLGHTNFIFKTFFVDSVALASMTDNVIDSQDVVANALSIPSDLALATKAELEGRISDVADFAEADGDVFTGVHDFGGATSLEIPNATAPAATLVGHAFFDTDDSALAIFDGAREVLVPVHFVKEFTIWNPDLITDTIPVIEVDSMLAQAGITLESFSATTSVDGTYTLNLYEFTGADPPVRVGAGTIATLGFAAGDQRDATQTFSDDGIGRGNHVYILTPSTDIDWVKIKIRYFINAND